MMRGGGLACALLIACGSASTDPRWQPSPNKTPRAGGTLHLAMEFDVNSLDPLVAADEVMLYFTHALFDTLVTYEPSTPDDPRAGLAFRPGLATAWTISDDGLLYTFTLRPALAYSDGTPVAAADFVWMLDRQLQKPGSAIGAMLLDIAGAPEVVAGTASHARGLVAPAPDTLEIHLARPNAALLGILAMPAATPQPHGREPDRRAPLGTGPYTLESWDEGERVVLRKNPRHWDAAHVYLDKLDFLENVPRDLQFLKFQRGEIDTAEHLEAPDALWLAVQPAWAPYVRTGQTLQSYGSRMNVTVKPFDDVRVRQALNYALDKSHSVRLLQDAAVAAHGILPPSLAGFNAHLTPYPHDPARARALLAAAGYPDGFDIDYVVMANDEALRLAASLQADLAEVGVHVHVRSEAFATFLPELMSRTGPPFAKATFGFDFPDAADAFDLQFGTAGIADEGTSNLSFYSNPTLDALLAVARAERDPATRALLYQQAELIVYVDAVWLWDYHQKAVEVVQPYVADYQPHPVWIRDYAHTWLDLGPDGEPVPRAAP